MIGPAAAAGDRRTLRQAGVTFRCTGAVKAPVGRGRKRSVVVEDRPDPPRGADERVAAGAEQVDVVALVRLLLLVARDRDADRLDGLARGERQRPGAGGVVLAGHGRAVPCGEVDADRLAV